LLFVIAVISGIRFAQTGFGPESILNTSSGAISVYSADLDADGDFDVLSAFGPSNKIAWFANDGTGDFSNQQIITANAE
jgi:hypothetical protein